VQRCTRIYECVRRTEVSDQYDHVRKLYPKFIPLLFWALLGKKILHGERLNYLSGRVMRTRTRIVKLMCSVIDNVFVHFERLKLISN